MDDDDDLSPLGAAASQPASKRSKPDKAKESGRLRSHLGRVRRRIPVGMGAVLIVLAVIALALVPMAWSSLAKTPEDKVGISYGGGLFEGRHFQRIVQPGSNLFFNGFSDSLFLYPADQRSYIVSDAPQAGDVARVNEVAAPSNDRVQVRYQLATYFKLNRGLLRQFHENLGVKYQAYTADGFKKLLDETLLPQIQNALQEVTRRYDVREIYGNADLLREIQREVQEQVSQRLAAALGERYFCGPDFEPGGKCTDVIVSIQDIAIPENVQAAFEQNRVSEVNILTETNKTIQRRSEAEGIQALSSALQAAGDDYVLLRAIESGTINFWVIPSENGLTIQAPDGSSTTTQPAPTQPTPAQPAPTQAAPAQPGG